MKKLILILVALIAGCGDPNYVETQAHIEEPRIVSIILGRIAPTDEDLKLYDKAPVVDGKSIPDGKIGIDDLIVWQNTSTSLQPE